MIFEEFKGILRYGKIWKDMERQKGSEGQAGASGKACLSRISRM